MRNRSLETRAFNHKIFGVGVQRHDAPDAGDCTMIVHHELTAPF